MYRFAGSPVVFGKGNVLHPTSSFPPVFLSQSLSAMSSSGGVRIGGVSVGCRVANRYRRSTVIVSALSTYQVRSSGGALVMYFMPFMLMFIRPPRSLWYTRYGFPMTSIGLSLFPSEKRAVSITRVAEFLRSSNTPNASRARADRYASFACRVSLWVLSICSVVES